MDGSARKNFLQGSGGTITNWRFVVWNRKAPTGEDLSKYPRYEGYEREGANTWSSDEGLRHWTFPEYGQYLMRARISDITSVRTS